MEGRDLPFPVVDREALEEAAFGIEVEADAVGAKRLRVCGHLSESLLVVDIWTTGRAVRAGSMIVPRQRIGCVPVLQRLLDRRPGCGLSVWPNPSLG
jgi:hypothetical protein